MTIPAWQLITWKPVLTTLADFRSALARMRPLGLPGGGQRPPQGGLSGQAFWAAEHRGQPVGLAWDWAEVRQDVVALSDPMNVLSNITLVDSMGEHLDAATRLLHLNSAIHMLEWQSHVTGHGEAWLQPLAA